MDFSFAFFLETTGKQDWWVHSGIGKGVPGHLVRHEVLGLSKLPWPVIL